MTLQLKDSFNAAFYESCLNCKIQKIHTEIQFYLPLSPDYVHTKIQRKIHYVYQDTKYDVLFQSLVLDRQTDTVD